MLCTIDHRIPYEKERTYGVEVLLCKSIIEIWPAPGAAVDLMQWIQMALWGLSAIGLFVGYRPPKRHTGYDHLTLWQKIGRLDLPGFFLLTAGLTIFLAGLNIGGGMFPWTAAPVLATLIVGILCLIFFGIYEWKFTKTGILSHELFQGGEFGGRNFALCVGLIFIEGILLFSYTIFFPTLFVPL